jgi:DMSO/TMAO reductase YedYZ molybdopterin-dependent catalytic subunit
VVCAADGFASEPVPVDVLAQGLLVHSLRGEPLPASAGGPYRLLIPPDVAGAPTGCANVKGVTRIVLRPDPD